MKTINLNLGGYKIIQDTNRSPTQMMSYRIYTPDGDLVVIDGGNAAEEPFLRENIMAHGGRVAVWIVTHCHSDHYGALAEILERPQGLSIDALVWNFPPVEWLNRAEAQYAADTARICGLLDAWQGFAVKPTEKTRLKIGGLDIEFLRDPYGGTEVGVGINYSSLVFKMRFPTGTEILFLGDLDYAAGETLADRYREALKSDAVQMAHHGQNGVGERVYGYARPSVCLWPTPDWLYDNLGGTGPYKTLETRAWMEGLGVREHATEADGDVLIV